MGYHSEIQSEHDHVTSVARDICVHAEAARPCYRHSYVLLRGPAGMDRVRELARNAFARNDNHVSGLSMGDLMDAAASVLEHDVLEECNYKGCAT